MMSRTLATPRLRVEPFGEEHLSQRYVGWLNDTEVVRFSEQRHRRHTLDTARAYWKSFEGTPHYFWAIVAADERIGHIGNINAYVDTHNSLADVGILIGDRNVWGRGYGLEAWQAVCQFLLHDRRLRKITAGTVDANAGMLSIMRRAGMKEDGRRARHYLIDGREADVVYAALFREGV